VIIEATTLLVSGCDSALSVNVKCFKIKYSETNKQFNNVNDAENSGSNLETGLSSRIKRYGRASLCEGGNEPLNNEWYLLRKQE
jgi:hypothetical protein